MSKTINLNYLNGDWVVNNASGTERVWTRGNYEIVYSESVFDTGNAGWIVKETDGVNIFALKTSGDPWASDVQIVWNPNASGYTSASTSGLSVKTIAERYLVSGAGVNSYNGLYSLNNSPSTFNGQSVYTNGTCYLFYSESLSSWVLNNELNSQYAYSGSLDGVWSSNNDTTPPSVVKYLPYMNLTSSNVKQGVYIDNFKGAFTQDANATSTQILDGYTAYVNGKKISGSITSSTPIVQDNQVAIPVGMISESQVITIGEDLGTSTYTPTIEDQNIITSGKYITGTQILKGDANLVSSNIKNGVTIFGVTGSLIEDNSEIVVQPSPVITLENGVVTASYTPVAGKVNDTTLKTSSLAVTSSIDSNIIPENIKSGTTILGVTGTLGSVQITLGEIDENGDFQPVSFIGTSAFSSGEPIVVSNYYTWNNIQQ